MRLERIAWTEAEPPSEAAVRATLLAEGFEALLWQDSPHAYYAPHAHEDDECLCVLAGEISFEVGGSRLRLGPGDRLRLPAGTLHAATAGPAGASYLIGRR